MKSGKIFYPVIYGVNFAVGFGRGVALEKGVGISPLDTFLLWAPILSAAAGFVKEFKEYNDKMYHEPEGEHNSPFDIFEGGIRGGLGSVVCGAVGFGVGYIGSRIVS